MSTRLSIIFTYYYTYIYTIMVTGYNKMLLQQIKLKRIRYTRLSRTRSKIVRWFSTGFKLFPCRSHKKKPVLFAYKVILWWQMTGDRFDVDIYNNNCPLLTRSPLYEINAVKWIAITLIIIMRRIGRYVFFLYVTHIKSYIRIIYNIVWV